MHFQIMIFVSLLAALFALLMTLNDGDTKGFKSPKLPKFKSKVSLPTWIKKMKPTKKNPSNLSVRSGLPKHVDTASKAFSKSSPSEKPSTDYQKKIAQYQRRQLKMEKVQTGIQAVQTTVEGVAAVQETLETAFTLSHFIKSLADLDESNSTQLKGPHAGEEYQIRLRWNNACLDGGWRSEAKSYTAYSRSNCEDSQAHLSWKYTQMQLTLNLEHIHGMACLTCDNGEVEEGHLKMLPCKDNNAGQQFEIVSFARQVDVFTQKRRYFSFQSLLHPSKCITVYSGTVLVDECLFTWEHCFNYQNDHWPKGSAPPPVEYSNPQVCYQNGSFTRQYACRRNVFRLEECTGDDFQSFFFAH